VSTATAKRIFYTLRHIKKYICINIYATGKNWLTGLAHLSTQKEINVDPNELVKRFALTPQRQGLILYFFK